MPDTWMPDEDGMEWREDPALATRLLQSLSDQLREGHSSRTNDVPHVTELIYCLTKSYLNRFDPIGETDETITIFLLGTLLERILLQKQKYHISDIVDGISFETDFIAAFNDIPGELKSTRISAKRDPMLLPLNWKRQVLSYMYTLVKLGVIEVDKDGYIVFSFVIFHLMGKYNPPFPMLKTWKVRSSRDNVIKNWLWIEDRRDIFLQHIADKTVPEPFTYNEDYECEYCPYLNYYCRGREAEKKFIERTGVTSDEAKYLKDGMGL